MIGILWMQPEGRLPEDTWLIGVGIIMLGLNGVRHLYGLKMSNFTIVVGVLALLAGIDDYLGFEVPILPIIIILLGISILIGPKWFRCKPCESWFKEDKK